jgi:WD40 repeat protein
VRSADRRHIERFASHHGGNPYAIRFAAQFIRNNYSGDLGSYVDDGLPLPGRVRDLLQQQLDRLSELARICVLRVAAQRAPLTAQQLVDGLSFRWKRREVAAAIEELHKHLMLEPSSADELGLQNLLVEHATDTFIDHVVEALVTKSADPLPDVVAAVPLLTPAAESHLLAAQSHAMARPVAKELERRLGPSGVREHLLALIERHRGRSAKAVGHALGTAVNLLLLDGDDLAGADLSQLVLWNVCFDPAQLQDATLSDSDVAGSTFSEVLGVITDAVFAPDGRAVFAVTADGLLRRWDIETWHSEAVHAHNGYARAVAYDRIARRLVTVGDDRCVRMWDPDDLSHIADLTTAPVALRAVAAAPGRALLAWGGAEGDLAIWDAASATTHRLTGHSTTVRACSFLDDTTLVSADEHGVVITWRVDDGARIASHQVHGPLWTVAVSEQGEIAVGGQDGTVTILDRDLAPRGPAIEPVGCPIWRLTFVDSLLCAATSGAIVYCWDAASGQATRQFARHSNWVRALTRDPTSSVLASGGDDQTLCLFDPVDGRTLREVRGSARSFWAVAYSRDGSRLAAGGSERSVYVWQDDGGRPVRLSGYAGWVRALAFSTEGRYLAAAGDSGEVWVWDLAAPEHRHRVVGRHRGPIWSVAFSHDGERIVTAGEDRTVRVWSAGPEPHAVTGVVQEHDGWAVSARFSPDDRLLASGADGGTLLVSAADGSGRTPLIDGRVTQPWALDWGPSGEWLCSSGRDGIVRLWDVASARVVSEADQGRWIWSCAVVDDGRSLLLAGDQGLVAELGLPDLRPSAPPVQNGEARIRALACPASGDRFATVGDDGVVRIRTRGGAGLRTLTPDRQYERLRLDRTRGLTEAQLASLELLGADVVPVVGVEQPESLPKVAVMLDDEQSSSWGWSGVALVGVLLLLVVIAVVVLATSS